MDANGPTAIPVTLAGSAAIAVPINTAVYTDAIQLCDCDQFALSYKAAGTGTAGVKIEMQMGIVPPAAGNASDVNFVVPETISDIVSNLTNKNQHHQSIAPVPVRYIRFKITELTNVMTDLVMTLNLSVQKKYPTSN